MQDYRKLTVWQSSMALAKDCYTVTMSFPRSELFGLTDQIRRSAVSIPSNISEGSGRGTSKEFARYLRIAYASGCELGTQLELARRIPMGPEHELADLLSQVEDIRRMLTTLTQRIETGNS
ncbi:MAG: four helix bundle protein [Actinomycetia bacterium]|nr:four helix bundle protein [Actinomycetes bacterium]